MSAAEPHDHEAIIHYLRPESTPDLEPAAAHEEEVTPEELAETARDLLDASFLSGRLIPAQSTFRAVAAILAEAEPTYLVQAVKDTGMHHLGTTEAVSYVISSLCGVTEHSTLENPDTRLDLEIARRFLGSLLDQLQL